MKTEYYGHNARYIHYDNIVTSVQPNLPCMFQKGKRTVRTVYFACIYMPFLVTTVTLALALK
jgi:hypothetical protein